MASLQKHIRIDRQPKNRGVIPLKCLQQNLQHSRAATINLTKTIEDLDSDIIFIQEPHLINNRIIGIPTTHRTFTSGPGKKRAAITITNKQIDAVLIHQLSDADITVLEIKRGILKFIAVSMYMDISEDITNASMKIDRILQPYGKEKIVFAIDSNARSKIWHDKINNARGKILEEYLISR